MKRCVGFIISVFALSGISAQSQLSDNLQQQFKNYQSVNLQEKLFVHTDKTFYLSGETIWFKVYAVDGTFHKPLTLSSISYIEILNRDLKPVVQTKVSMIDGSGNGSMILPGFLTTGNYTFRAYTSWMKNFQPEYFYEQTIHIVNTLKTTSIPFAARHTASIQFFPEGGNLVSGLTTKIAFKALDSNGRGLSCIGVIVNDHLDTVTRIQSVHNGMGNFILTPVKGMNYYAILKLDDSTIKQRLPDISEQGFAMTVTKQDTDRFLISVQATPELNTTMVYLFTHSGQIIKNVQSSSVKDGKADFIIYKRDLGDGISGVTLFNYLRQPVCERLVFKRPEKASAILVKTDQTVYTTRNLINMTLTSGETDSLASGNFSVSAFMIDSLQRIPDYNIVSYLYLSSDLKGKIESPEYYFAQADKTTDDALDNLLLTQGWRRFKWNDLLAYRTPAFEFLPEIEGPVVNARLLNKLTGLPAEQTGAFLSTPGSDYTFSSATSKPDGVVHFTFKNIYKNNVIVVQPALQKDSNYRIDITSAWSDKFSTASIPSYSLSKDQETALLNRSVANQVENTYAIDKKRRYENLNLDTTSFFGKPDRTYMLEDYTRFQTMEEVLREYVDDLRVRKEGDKFNFKVRNKLFQTYFDESPLILLDGVSVADATKIIALDPAKVKKIEIITHRYYTGSSVFEGIVNVSSYNGELGATQIDPNSLVVEYDGIQQQREFYSPTYYSAEDQESHIPDFRNVLYWSPRVKTGPGGKTQLSFYTSDMKGKFAVIVQGLSTDGLPTYGITQFQVTQSKQ